MPPRIPSNDHYLAAALAWQVAVLLPPVLSDYAYYAPLEAWFRVSAFPSGQGIAISFTDVTAATNARRLLQRQNEELELRVRERTEALQRINEELATFTLAVAHDLRAPLAGIRGFARAAAERLGDVQDARVTHYLDRVDASAHRMEDLLAGLLSLSRVGSAELALQPVPGQRVFDDQADVLRFELQDRAR